MTAASHPTPEPPDAPELTPELTPNTTPEPPELTTESIMKATPVAPETPKLTPKLAPELTPEVTPNTATNIATNTATNTTPEVTEVTPVPTKGIPSEASQEASHEVTEQVTREITPEAFLQASTMVSPQAILQAALDYAARQWPVVPLYERDKKPLTEHGLKQASRDEQTIRTWWSQVPKANLGIRAGAKPEGAGILVLDIDKDHGGIESLQKLEQEHGMLPATVEVISGGGGRHLYFRYPEGILLKNSAGRLGDGLDTRGEDGYIVAPPSVHPCGKPYAWKEGHSPDEMALAELPEWMVTMLTSRPQANPEHLPARLQPQDQSLQVTQNHLLLVNPDQWLEAELNNVFSNVNRALEEMLRIKPREDEKDGSRRLYAYACRAVEYGLDDRVALQVIRLAESHLPLPKSYSNLDVLDRLHDAARNSQVKRGSKWRLVLDHEAPLKTAQQFLLARFTHQEMNTLYDYQAQLLAWNGRHYAELKQSGLRSLVYEYTNQAQAIVREKRLVVDLEPFNPDSNKVNRIIDAIKACTHIDDQTELPSWLWPQHKDPLLCTDPDPRQLIPMNNGLLDHTSGQLLAHTPRYLNLNILDFDYQPQAREPKLWLKFLHDLWGDDRESIRLLQQWFGYCLTADTSRQKILLMVGPKRSGKGTIGRILTSLLGSHNVCSPTLNALTQNFGLWQMIGKNLATITDARLSGRSDQAVIVERLLTISGEDFITIDRKYLKPWIGRLTARIMVMTNELPKLMDASGALASRFLLLRLTRSFYGQEDLGLGDRILAELPGIFNWALEGLRNLHQQGQFVQPLSSQELLQGLEELSSPIRAFIKDCCRIGENESATPAELYQAWRNWCQEQGRDNVGTVQTFGKDLQAAEPGIRLRQNRINGRRFRRYEGIGLNPEIRSSVTHCPA